MLPKDEFGTGRMAKTSLSVMKNSPKERLTSATKFQHLHAASPISTTFRSTSLNATAIEISTKTQERTVGNPQGKTSGRRLSTFPQVIQVATICLANNPASSAAVPAAATATEETTLGTPSELATMEEVSVMASRDHNGIHSAAALAQVTLAATEAAAGETEAAPLDEVAGATGDLTLSFILLH